MSNSRLLVSLMIITISFLNTTVVAGTSCNYRDKCKYITSDGQVLSHEQCELNFGVATASPCSNLDYSARAVIEIPGPRIFWVEYMCTSQSLERHGEHLGTHEYDVDQNRVSDTELRCKRDDGSIYVTLQSACGSRDTPIAFQSSEQVTEDEVQLWHPYRVDGVPAHECSDKLDGYDINICLSTGEVLQYDSRPESCY